MISGKYFKCISIGLVILTNSAFGQEISRIEYIEKYSSLAVKQMHQYKIPASITIAQGILESNNGNSRLAKKANNHFGIKCHGWEGKKIFADDDKKNECFRNYKNVLESFVDHSLFLNKYSRYKFLFEYKITDYKSWAKGLKKAGYATNNKYSELLIKIIEENKLYQFDNKKIDKNLIFSKRNIYMHPNKIKYVISQNQETYETISKSLNIKLKQILKYNDDDNLSALNQGTKVFIQPKRNRSKERIHLVKKGEDLRTISQTYGIKMKSLKKRNELILKNSLNNGDKLRLR